MTANTDMAALGKVFEGIRALEQSATEVTQRVVDLERENARLREQVLSQENTIGDMRENLRLMQASSLSNEEVFERPRFG